MVNDCLFLTAVEFVGLWFAGRNTSSSTGCGIRESRVLSYKTVTVGCHTKTLFLEHSFGFWFGYLYMYFNRNCYLYKKKLHTLICDEYSSLVKNIILCKCFFHIHENPLTSNSVVWQADLLQAEYYVNLELKKEEEYNYE